MSTFRSDMLKADEVFSLWLAVTLLCSSDQVVVVVVVVLNRGRSQEGRFDAKQQGSAMGPVVVAPLRRDALTCDCECLHLVAASNSISSSFLLSR